MISDTVFEVATVQPDKMSISVTDFTLVRCEARSRCRVHRGPAGNESCRRAVVTRRRVFL